MKFSKKEKRFWKTKFSFGLNNIPEEIDHLTFRDEYLSNEELCYITSRIKRIERLDLDSTSVDDDGIPFLLEMDYIGAGSSCELSQAAGHHHPTNSIQSLR